MSYTFDSDVTACSYRTNGFGMVSAFMDQARCDAHMEGLGQRGNEVEILKTEVISKSQYDNWRDNALKQHQQHESEPKAAQNA